MTRRGFLDALAAAPLLALAAEPVKRFELALANGRVDQAYATLRVTRGERVELRWSSDRPIALHLHGYDVEASVAPRAPATMAFTASIAGRFPVSEHAQGAGRHRAILYLEVHP